MACANEDVPVEPEETRKCTSCGSSRLLSDSCAAEDILVCQECGSVMAAGYFDNRKNIEDILRPSSATPNTAYNSGAMGLDSVQRGQLGIQISSILKRKIQLATLICIMCDKLRIPNRDRNICLDKLTELSKLESIPFCERGNSIAAAIVFLCATDRSIMSMKNVNSILQMKMKNFRFVIKKLKELPSFKSTDTPSRKPSVQEVFANELDRLGVMENITERKKCLSMCSNVWDLLKTTDLINKDIHLFNPNFIGAIILITMENMYKTKTQAELHNMVDEKLNTQSFTYRRFNGLIRKTLYTMAKDIPTLEFVKGEKKGFTPATVPRYLSTIVQNKAYLLAKKRISDHEAKLEAEKNVENEDEARPFLCLPIPQFDWTDDEEGTFSDIDDGDLDQYLATDEEIEVKRKTLEMILDS